MKRIWFVSGIILLVFVGAAGIFLFQSTSWPMAVRAQEPVENLKAEKILAIAVERNINGDVITLGTGSIEVEVGVEIKNDEEPVRTVNVSHSGDLVEI